jgi:hypothetical protein
MGSFLYAASIKSYSSSTKLFTVQFFDDDSINDVPVSKMRPLKVGTICGVDYKRSNIASRGWYKARVHVLHPPVTSSSGKGVGVTFLSDGVVEECLDLKAFTIRAGGLTGEDLYTHRSERLEFGDHVSVSEWMFATDGEQPEDDWWHGFITAVDKDRAPGTAGNTLSNWRLAPLVM